MSIKNLVFFMPLTLFAVNIFNGNKDFQFWLQDQVEGVILGRLHARAEQEFRFTEHSSKLYYFHNQISFKYLASPHFELEPTYRQVYFRKKNSPNSWQPVYEPILDVTLKGVSSGWKFADRNRVEYVMKSGPAKTLWVYRNRLLVVSPFYYFAKAAVPMAFGEFFWREQHGIDQTRLAGGLQINLIGKARGNVLYMWRSLKRQSGWIHQNVIFTQIQLSF
ncbi:MAG: hypothetical protein SP1CHLAM54_07560 [Chlamydiia bacterium]|nr:hypothetical protein [Chlamydiia bacterium]MCH9615662.1 hypothetical protein [Chlamydiia bacterium]MCH9628935.1 hypothetical protein [Chlamydiia bacterium]